MPFSRLAIWDNRLELYALDGEVINETMNLPPAYGDSCSFPGSMHVSPWNVSQWKIYCTVEISKSLFGCGSCRKRGMVGGEEGQNISGTVAPRPQLDFCLLL